MKLRTIVINNVTPDLAEDFGVSAAEINKMSDEMIDAYKQAAANLNGIVRETEEGLETITEYGTLIDCHRAVQKIDTMIGAGNQHMASDLSDVSDRLKPAFVKGFMFREELDPSEPNERLIKITIGPRDLQA